MTLGQMQVGQVGVVQGFAAAMDGSYRARLLAFGLTMGTRVEVVRVAPLGDPMEILVRGVHIMLRRAEASGINMLPSSL